MFLNGVWWWEMATTYYITWGELADTFKNGPMATHYAYARQLYTHIIWVVGFFVIVMLVMEYVDRSWFKKTREHIRVQGDIPNGLKKDFVEDMDVKMYALEPESHQYENSVLNDL
eukprot:TRINITY_DN3871_c0_g1_i3.p1 TRINITY_DN3871_c0_g1~~TRINITY_DN3871_c0_g1_i3.p1  ORF type:complete len:115 (-),score=14.63 TRINITY_DN3871_c0_g1_i3:97-441(-)